MSKVIGRTIRDLGRLLSPRSGAQGDFVLTREDWATLLSSAPGPALKRKLADSTLVRAEAVPPDVVTLKSRFSYLDESAGEWQIATLSAEPASAAGGREKLSVRTLLGAALLGAASGHTLKLGKRSVRVGEVLYQPERARYGALPLAP